jgi:hypothetical protein
MYSGDRIRKMNLVEYGFRLPSALDNRPLQFDEFETLTTQKIYVSATPSEYELEKSEGVIVEQIVRPTGLLDPEIDVRPTLNQIDDLLKEIDLTIQANERILMTTLTKRMAEELDQYLGNLQIRSRYIHSDVDTLDRVEILRGLRIGDFDVLIASYFDHVKPYSELIKKYNLKTKLIFQMGNEWPVDWSIVDNLLASTKKFAYPSNKNRSLLVLLLGVNANERNTDPWLLVGVELLLGIVELVDLKVPSSTVATCNTVPYFTPALFCHSSNFAIEAIIKLPRLAN